MSTYGDMTTRTTACCQYHREGGNLDYKCKCLCGAVTPQARDACDRWDCPVIRDNDILITVISPVQSVEK